MHQPNSGTKPLENLNGKVLTEPEQDAVQKLLNANPQLWKRYGNLNNQLRDTALLFIQDDTVEQLSVAEGLRQMRFSLLAEGSTPLEVVAVDQIINNHIQVARSGYELEKLEPTEDNKNVCNHWFRLHNAAQSRLFKAINWLTKLRKLKLDDLIRKKAHTFANFNRDFAISLKNIDKQIEILKRIENGEQLTDEELGIEVTAPAAKPKEKWLNPFENFFKQSDENENQVESDSAERQDQEEEPAIQEEEAAITMEEPPVKSASLKQPSPREPRDKRSVVKTFVARAIEATPPQPQKLNREVSKGEAPRLVQIPRPPIDDLTLDAMRHQY